MKFPFAEVDLPTASVGTLDRRRRDTATFGFRQRRLEEPLTIAIPAVQSALRHRDADLRRAPTSAPSAVHTERTPTTSGVTPKRRSLKLTVIVLSAFLVAVLGGLVCERVRPSLDRPVAQRRRPTAASGPDYGAPSGITRRFRIALLIGAPSGLFDSSLKLLNRDIHRSAGLGARRIARELRVASRRP